MYSLVSDLRINRRTKLVRWLAWVLSRVVLLLLVVANTQPAGDVYYYSNGMNGEEGALREYPQVGTWPLYLVHWLTNALCSGSSDLFLWIFVAFCIVVDAGFFAAVVKSCRAAFFWVLFGLVAGYVFVLRLDIFPGVIMGFAALLLFNHSRIASALIAVAMMIKLWPGVLAAGIVGSFKEKASWARVAAFAGTGAVLTAVVAATGGLSRLTSPLDYQSVRGLQIESVFASPFMLLSAYSPGKYDVEYAASKSYEITGPGVTAAARAASISMIVVVVLALAWAVWHFLSKHQWRPEVAQAWMMLMVLLLILTNKVFSPQYVIWIAPLVAAALLREDSLYDVTRARKQSVSLMLLAALVVAMAALSTLIYPVFYGGLIDSPTAIWTAWLLVARNALLVICIGLAARYLAELNHSHQSRSQGDRARRRALLEQPS